MLSNNTTKLDQLNRDIRVLREELKSARGEESVRIVNRILEMQREIKLVVVLETQTAVAASPITIEIPKPKIVEPEPLPTPVVELFPEEDEIEEVETIAVVDDVLEPKVVAPPAEDALPEWFRERVDRMIEDRLDGHKLRKLSDRDIREGLSVAKDINEARQYLRLLLDEITRAEIELRTLRPRDEDEEPPELSPDS